MESMSEQERGEEGRCGRGKERRDEWDEKV